MKRLFDFLLAIIAGILLLPFIFIVSVIIFTSMGRPILFSQMRPGLKGKPFCIYKFRTMKNTVDRSGTMLPDDKRLTAVGKIVRRFSLDELPQLYNVIRGDLSFVGPRPLLMEYLSLYSDEQMRRHDVRPGITGWTQVNGRNALSWEEKFKLDLWYVDNRSFFLDMKILYMTVMNVLKREGINADGCATMPKFTGSAMGDK